jgi:hypothetical protein
VTGDEKIELDKPFLGINFLFTRHLSLVTIQVFPVAGLWL